MYVENFQFVKMDFSSTHLKPKSGGNLQEFEFPSSP